MVHLDYSLDNGKLLGLLLAEMTLFRPPHVWYALLRACRTQHTSAEGICVRWKLQRWRAHEQMSSVMNGTATSEGARRRRRRKRESTNEKR